MLVSNEILKTAFMLAYSFVNQSLTDASCLIIAYVSLYCFGTPKRSFPFQNKNKQRGGQIFKIANDYYRCLKLRY